MKPLSPDKRIAFGLVTLTVAVLIAAQLFGILPDEQKSKLESRKILIESVALQVSRFARSNRLLEIKSILQSIVKRNPEVQSAAIRSNNGYLLVEAGKHRKLWTLKSKDTSTANQVQVSVFAGSRKWGNMEIHFSPVNANQLFGLSINKNFLLIVFVALAGYFLYGFLLRKTLNHLDPNAVIPDRVKNAMNIISEGLLIMDEKERIILANNAFANLTGETPESLMGKTPRKMQWKHQLAELPWTEAQKTNKSISDVHMNLQTKQFGTRAFLVNAAPITGDEGKVRGTMVTFNDVTQLQIRNTQLNKAVHTLKKSEAEVHKKNKELAFLASRDPLTGCLNRRAFYETIEPQFDSLMETGEAFACIMLDIDHFKSVNDTYGHGVGDVVIKILAKTVLANLRSGDMACRYGGEEFVLYLKDINADGAMAIAERIRQQIEQLDFSNDPATKDMKITSSFGIADQQDYAKSMNEMIELADQALYYSKENGRNQVNQWYKIKDILKQQKIDAERQNNVTEILTGRPGFISLLKQTIEQGNEKQQGLSVFLVNIDKFKRINNTLGHHVGDRLIDEIQQRLTERFDQRDISASTEIFNLKGDEFGIIYSGNNTPEQIKTIADAIQQCIKHPLSQGESEVNLTCSIGSSIYPQDGESPEVLLRNIEVAVNRAKDRGGHVHQPYLAEFNTGSIDELDIESKLHSALSNNELYLHYQPKVDLNTGKIRGLEALARWRNPELGDVSPGRFIPIAEQSGLINELGLWVLKTACLQANKWIQVGLSDLRIAVNLSAIQLKKHDFLDRVMTIFTETGFDPHNLELEVTENMMMENIETVTPILYQLHEKGVSISIDDFGIGYSSLNYIKRFPISVIKIDRSFIMNIEDDKDDHAIVSAIIAMAHAMKLKVVAEGAEHSQQIDILRKLNCDQLQGFIFSKPLPFDAATKLLLANAKCSPGPDSLNNQIQEPQSA